MKPNTLEEDLITKLGRAGFDKIRNARIGIAGAGGLGSNCAACLVRSGFLKLTVVDFDMVEPSNLDRQLYFRDQVGMPKVEALRATLMRIDPDLELKTVLERIGQGMAGRLFADCDAIAECLDTAESKTMLVSELMKMGKFTVAASGLGGVGDSDSIVTRRVAENLVMVGDGVSDICAKPAIAPRVMVAAAKQADALLSYIIGRE